MSSDRRPSVDDQTLRLQQILDSSPALIHTGRPDGYLDFFNRTWCEFVGTPWMEMDLLRSSGRYRSAPGEVARVNRHGKSIRDRS
jgi:hypothetical protein